MKPTITSERKYAKELKKIAKVTASIVMSHTDEWKYDVAANALLSAYSKSIAPWASRTAMRMIKEVLVSNNRGWSATSKSIGQQFKTELTGKVGITARQLHDAQVELIQSIPIEAGERAQRLSMEAVTGGRRASEVAEEIARTEEVTKNRAMLIARTEVSKANASITQARAESVGVDSYYWRTSGDQDVRDSHAELEGQIFTFSNPPYIEGEGAHGPGETFNCRCWAEVIVQDAKF
jgi:SPP1 gp7 family putative phage head morphogenesis protein